MAMAKLRSSQVAKKNAGSSNANGIIKVKVLVVEKFQKSLILLGYKPTPPRNKVPKDVKEGHIAVIAVEDDEEKRFVIPLSYLTYPSFVRLLEEAAEEYGFGHEGGALTVSCRPCHLERMMVEKESGVGVNWDMPETMVATF